MREEKEKEKFDTMGEEKEKEKKVFKCAEHAWGGGGGMERVLGVLVGSVACAW